MPPKKNYNKKRSQTVKRKSSKKKLGLNNVEKKQVGNMIKGKRETFYLKTIQYALGQTITIGDDLAQLTPQDCFQSANRITMIGLTSADTFTSIGDDLNSNVVHMSGQRLFLTGGCRARDLGGVSGASLGGDMGYMKSHLQKIKIHAKSRSVDNADNIKDQFIPLNFRVLCVQVNGNKPSGNLPSFTNVGSTGAPSLFRDRNGVKQGIDNLIHPYEFSNNLRVDTNAFKVIRDIRFKLSNPLLAGSVANVTSNSVYQYPATKEIEIWLPQPKKPVKFDAGTQLPTNYDYRYYTFVFCCADSAYGGNNLGTTENRWCLESTSIARVQEY